MARLLIAPIVVGSSPPSTRRALPEAKNGLALLERAVLLRDARRIDGGVGGRDFRAAAIAFRDWLRAQPARVAESDDAHSPRTFYSPSDPTFLINYVASRGGSISARLAALCSTAERS